MKKVLFTALVAVVLLLSLAGPVAAAPPVDNPGKEPVDRIVFVHYGKDFAPGKSAAPAKVPATPSLYSYNGIHWANDKIPVQYWINPANCPITDGTDANAGVTAAFQTWQNDPLSYIAFMCNGTTSTAPGINAASPDYQNVVGWAYLSDTYPNAIAVTVVWYSRYGKLIVDCDTALNTDATFAWTQATITADPNTILLTDTPRYDVDVQNIMTHESGHWLMLNDLYTSAASEQTMYGYASDRELKKCSLESGDLAGVQKIYPVK